MRASAALAGCALAATAVVCGGSVRAAASARGVRAFEPISVTAVSENDFWVLGRVPCTRRGCLTIRRTSDGGRSFASVSAPPVPVRDAVPALRFADRDDGWAFSPGGRVFYATHDGGTTWRRLPLRNVLAFASGGGTAYAVTASCRPSGCTRYALRRSPVSRDAWTARPLPVAPDGSVVGLAVHGTHVWLLATRAGRHTRDTLARSSDGGRTFAKRVGPCYAGLGGDLEPVSAAVVWAVCPTGMMAGAFRSTDGGRTFAPLRTPPLVNSTAIAPASASVAVLARQGPGTPLLRTTNGGRTWKRVAKPPPAAYTPFAGFTDARVGYVLVQTGFDRRLRVSRQQLWRTTDGGARWYRVVLR